MTRKRQSEDRQPDGTFADHSFIMDGRHLTAIDAKKLEESLRHDESDTRSRLLLLGYLERDNRRARRFATHLCWFIDNHPTHPALEHLGVTNLTGALHDLVKNHWLRQVRARPKNTSVIRNAESFCTLRSPKTAERLLKKAIEIEPANEEWYWLLSHLYRITTFSEVFGTPENVAKKSLALGRRAFDLYDRKPKYGYLSTYYIMCAQDLAEHALKCGLYESASAFGKRLTNLPKKTFKFRGRTKLDGSKYGSAPHTGHEILGIVAIRNDNVALACEHLLKMSDYPMGSGFHFGLVTELLEHDRFDEVTEYLTKMLNRCRSSIEGLHRQPVEVSSQNQREILREQQAKGRPAAPFINYWLQNLQSQESYLLEMLTVAQKRSSRRP